MHDTTPHSTPEGDDPDSRASWPELSRAVFGTPGRGLPGRARWISWIAIACLLELLFLLLTRLSFDFDYGEQQLARPIPAVVAALVAAGVLFLVAAFLARRRAPPGPRFILLAALAFRITMLFSDPIQEDDFYRYLWDGKVVASGVDPYRYSPDEIRQFAGVRVEDLPESERAMATVVALRERSRANRTIFERVNHAHLATIYPPVAELVFAIPGSLTPHEWSVRSQIFCLRLTLLAFDVGCMLIIIALLRATRMPTGLVFLYAWCPIVVKEIVNSVHVDVVPAFFMLAAILAAFRRRALLAGLAIAASVLAKYYAILALPFVMLLFLRGREKRSIRTLPYIDFALVAAPSLLALLGIDIVFAASVEARRETLREFLNVWELNDAVFAWISGALRLITGDDSSAREYGRFVAAGLLLLAGAYQITREWARPRIDERALLGALGALLGAAFVLSPVAFPWYFIWLLPLLPWARRMAWLVLVVTLPLYYLRFHLLYRQGIDAGDASFQNWIVPVEFGVFFALWCFEWTTRRAR